MMNRIVRLVARGPFIELLKRFVGNSTVRAMCLRRGFLPCYVSSIDYHSPIPDVDDLMARHVWEVRSELRGIDFRERAQLTLLKTIGRNWSHECKWPWQATSNPTEFYLNNPSFSFGCAASTHGIIRQFKPSRVIEVGSGMSSLVIARALALNRENENVASEYIIIDPHPRPFIKQLAQVSGVKSQRVELLQPRFFDRLNRNSILFIDSSHTVRIGGDVNYLFHDVLPRLAKGVIIHVHDIGLPYEYGISYATNEKYRQFWTEQYLLQSFLCYNFKFEILLAMGWLMNDHMKEFQTAFPDFDPKHDLGSGSFWMRRKVSR